MSEELTREIKSLVARVIKIPEDKVNLDANLFAELGVDSLLGLEIFSALDKKFRLNIPEDKLKGVKTLNDLVSLVQQLLNR